MFWSGPASGRGVLQYASGERGWLLRRGLFGARETEETVPSHVDGMDPLLYFTATHAFTELLETSINRRVQILGPCPPKAGIARPQVHALDALQNGKEERTAIEAGKGLTFGLEGASVVFVLDLPPPLIPTSLYAPLLGHSWLGKVPPACGQCEVQLWHWLVKR